MKIKIKLIRSLRLGSGREDLTTKFPEVSSTHLIDLGRKKD